MKISLSLILLATAAGACGQVLPPHDPAGRPPPPEIAPTPHAVPRGSPVNPPKPTLVRPRKVEMPPAQPLPPVDTLSGEAVRKAIETLKTNYLQQGALSDDELERATLQGLLDRLAPAVSISGTDRAATRAASPFHAEIYRGQVEYLRLGQLSSEGVEQAKRAMEQWKEQRPSGLILDLRGTPATGEFEAAAAAAGLFCGKGVELFKLRPSQGRESGKGTDADREFKAEEGAEAGGLLVVLIDQQTAQAVEALAACLRVSGKALLVGGRTAGRAFQYQNVPLEDGLTLRIPTARVVLGDGTPLSDAGVKPDVAVELTSKRVEEIEKNITEHGVESVVTEKKRLHLNEAALVSGSNPEIDTLEADQGAAREPGERHLVDTQLQAALDMITSITLYQREREGTTAPRD